MKQEKGDFKLDRNESVEKSIKSDDLSISVASTSTAMTDIFFLSL